ncbi:nucleotidyltransferase [Aerosakkonemataceae cyanobacterium BLCC-F154]|uniref:Nucleotidyltransferase n=1 Tax=Floridaenema fluviatile BLCC-F154 TaxID=3153640 RepID=A0ABV4YF90_9CYAN
MNAILKTGELLTTDAQGFIINPCSFEKISPPWTAIIADLKIAYLEIFANQLHSIYIRGSVPRGKAIPKVSDLDSLAVISGNLEECQLAKIRLACRKIKHQYPFCKNVDFLCVSYQEIMESESTLKMLIKTQSLCIFGDDLTLSLPNYKPGIEMVSHAFELGEDLEILQDELQCLGNNDIFYFKFIKDRCAWIMKRIVRTGLELVMLREQVYTRDLYPSYLLFYKHYPTQERYMKKALELAINPSDNLAGLLIFLREFGSWLVREVERVGCVRKFHTDAVT